jgi:peptidoglycan/xylan/chitin deacetylase (PgdA/CDA1 family)
MSTPERQSTVAENGRRPGLGDRLPSTAVVHGKRVITRARSLRWAITGRSDPHQAGIRILLYHRIGRDQLGVTPAQFTAQMDYLAATGFRGVSVSEAVNSIYDNSGKSEGGPSLVGLSFDDGYRTVVEHGQDVLRRHGFRATIFVVPDAAGGELTFPWDLASRESHPVLSWDEIVALDGRSPFSFEPHSMSHPALTELSIADARDQIRRSKLVLEERLNRPAELFAYPGGWYGARERALVADAGYMAACTCEPGMNTKTTDRFQLRRVAVSSNDSLLDFRAKVHGAHDTDPPFRRAYRRIKRAAHARR